jgi:hypothetical protein
MARGMKLFPNVCFVYEHVFSSTTVIATCAIMDNARYTIFGWVKSIMTLSIKVRKLFLVIKISNSPLIMVGENVGILFLYMCSTFQHNSCDGIPKSIFNAHSHTSIKANWYPNYQWYNVCPHKKHERCVIVGVRLHWEE